MTHHETKLRLADIWEHLSECYRQWQHADEDAARWLAPFLVRDLEECRRLCEASGRPGTYCDGLRAAG
ncbi:MAG: hypothetical protein HY000_26115 [Planctomycetes bacterium]|nr:hypothetical protein [Planctomycetota bacterium]